MCSHQKKARWHHNDLKIKVFLQFDVHKELSHHRAHKQHDQVQMVEPMPKDLSLRSCCLQLKTSNTSLFPALLI